MKYRISFVIPFFLLLMLVISSGCVEVGSISGSTKIPGISVQTAESKETSDVITIADMWTLPKSPIFTDQRFQFYVSIRNSDPVRQIDNVKVELFDKSIFKYVSTSGPSECGSGCSIPPMSEKIIFFDLRAPSASEIANTETIKRLSIRVSYPFRSSTVYDVIVIDQTEVEKQQQAGRTLSIVSNKRIGTGPVRVHPQLAEQNFLIGGVPDIIKFTLRNEGEGIVQNNRIETGKFRISYYGGFMITAYAIAQSLLSQFALTGNLISITGMALANGDPCTSNSQCSSGCCLMDYDLGQIVCQDAYLCNPNLPRPNGVACTSNSQCSSGCCYNDPLVGWTCQGAYRCDPTLPRPDGEPCTLNSQCLSGCCYYDYPDGWTCQDAYLCNPNLPRPNGVACTSNSQCSSGCCYNDPLVGWTCQDIKYCSGAGSTIITTTTTPTTPASPTSIQPSTTLPPSIEQRITPVTYLTCSGGVCTNSAPIEFFDKESPNLVFRITGPEISGSGIYRSFPLNASVEYVYELRESFDIRILPV